MTGLQTEVLLVLLSVLFPRLDAGGEGRTAGTLDPNAF